MPRDSSAGTCGLTCVGGTTDCNGLCIELDVDPNKKTAVVNTLPDWESVPFPVDFQLVVEFYSKRL